MSSVALLLFGVCVRMSLRLLYGARGPAPDDGVYMTLRIVGWALIIGPAIVLAAAGASWLSLILIAAVVEAGIELVLARRSAQRQAVWRLVTGAVGSGRSLTDALKYHQRRFSGIVGRWEQRLLIDLERGVEWREAIWRNRPAVPREAPTFAAMVDRGSGPTAKLADFDEVRYPAYQQLQQEALQRFMYLATVMTVMGGIISFVMIKIIPSFQSIFEDFDLELPKLTIALVNMAVSFSKYLAAPLFLLFAFLIVGAIVVAGCYLFDIPVLQKLIDRLTMYRHRAQVMRLLAVGFDYSRPIDHTLMRLTGGHAPYPSAPIRRRLDRVRARVEAGHEWQQALAATGLATANEAAVMRSAQATGNLPWALRMLAQRKMNRATFRWALFQQVGFVFVVLALGMFVAFFAVSMMVPLSDLILNLSQ